MKTTTTDLMMPARVRAHFRKQEEPLDVVETPFPTWNRHCRDDGGGQGLPRGWYTLIGGGTGHGKSLLALNIGARAMEQGISPAFISLEMSPTQLATRLYAVHFGIEVRKLERGSDYDPIQARRVEKLSADLRDRLGVGFFTNLEPLVALSDVLQVMTDFHDNHQVRLFFVDYIQLVSLGDEQETVREVTKISHALRAFARKKEVTVLGLSQYNRTTSSNRFASPIPQSLIGSSALENDSDQVLLLDHSRYDRREGEEVARTWALLAKNRHGSVGEIPILWDFRTLRVREALQDEEHEWHTHAQGGGNGRP